MYRLNDYELQSYINEDVPYLSNVKSYAQTGIDGVVTSAMYLCGLSDIGTKMEVYN